MCLLARVGLITLAEKALREAAGRREVAMRLVEEMRRERRTQWMALLSGPRRGNSIAPIVTRMCKSES